MFSLSKYGRNCALRFGGAAAHPSTSLRYAQGDRGINQRFPESVQWNFPRRLQQEPAYGGSGRLSAVILQRRYQSRRISPLPQERRSRDFHSDESAATMARSPGFTDSTLKSRAAAAMRVSAAAIGMDGFLSFFFKRTQRTGLIRATT